MVLFLAGLSAIDRTYYDAAKVDGANRWQLFRRITLPLLQPTMVFVVVTGVIATLQVFGPVYIMSSGGDGLPGGPANSTMVVSIYQWLVAFRELDLGYGSAMGVILFVIILILTLAAGPSSAHQLELLTMYPAGHAYNLMSPAEIETIHRHALHILGEMGMEIQNRQLLEVLGDSGLDVDLETERVRFPASFVEWYLDEVEKYDWSTARPRVGGSAGVYHGLYHDPASNELVPWTEERLTLLPHWPVTYPSSTAPRCWLPPARTGTTGTALRALLLPEIRCRRFRLDPLGSTCVPTCWTTIRSLAEERKDRPRSFAARCTWSHPSNWGARRPTS